MATPPSRPQKVLILGSGPIVIGQAAEFDYAGTQACKAMREEGVISVLVNSNPATIMTDEDIADVVYIEPLTVPVVEQVIAQERPEGLLPTLGGQTGLNLAVDLAEAGVLDRYGVRLLGTPLDTIRRAEDRDLFRSLMQEIGEPVPESVIVTSVREAKTFARKIGFPLIIRPAYTLGGTGGGVARDGDDFTAVVERGLHASPIGQVLVERSLIGWKEIEYEVMRDGADNCITVCNMENFDPMGVHTGDSIVVAPSQTLSDKEYQMLRSASLKIIRALGIEGGCNIQFALNPQAFEYSVIEVNPRVSRSSALASKATGYPIARVAAKIAVGKTLDQIPFAVTGQTTAAFEPALDYIVVKIPRWPFDKFPGGNRILGTQMKATGEVMAIDRTFEAALQKAVRALEMGGRALLWEAPTWQQHGTSADGDDPGMADIWRHVERPHDLRLWALMAALRREIGVDELAERTAIDRWFLRGLERVYQMERRLLAEDLTPALLWDAKRLGFSDAHVGTLADRLPEQVRAQRQEWGIRPVFKMVDTCAAEFAAQTPYFYSAYELENEALLPEGQASAVIGSGPIRIGQGIEFDYCSVHSAWALQDAGVRSIMLNSNPETVSTDFDTSDRLYFESLDEESVQEVLANEGWPPVVVQFGGQTAINLAEPLAKAGAPVLGSSVTTIDLAEDRKKFELFLDRLGIPQPPGSGVSSVEDALSVANLIEYPVLVRPSYVLGGRAMEIVSTPDDLRRLVTALLAQDRRYPVLIDKYLQGREVEVDAICDGTDTLIPGIMEHIERAGVHSGDSFAVYPPVHLTAHDIKRIVEYTIQICASLEARGLINIQYVLHQGEVYVLEVNPRSSRTVPFLSKVTGVPMVRLATQVMLGQRLADLGFGSGLWPTRPLVAVKAPVFSMAKLVGVDTFLGPEMKSTGEVMGVDSAFAPALRKAMMAAGVSLPPEGGVLLSIADRDKAEAETIIRALGDAGYRLYATEGTAAVVRQLGYDVTEVGKLTDGDQTIIDLIRAGRAHLVVNTVTGGRPVLQDGFEIRRAAAEHQVPCLTSLDTVGALLESLTGGTEYSVRPLPAYRAGHSEVVAAPDIPAAVG
ncbi:MAG: carbamoyl phosphate synthase large subunit [Dehalococcoidia bacterium]|nr:carbamoyl phosphate synthase large subunit [Dehalococcoidia bacterium]